MIVLVSRLMIIFAFPMVFMMSQNALAQDVWTGKVYDQGIEFRPTEDSAYPNIQFLPEPYVTNEGIVLEDRYDELLEYDKLGISPSIIAENSSDTLGFYGVPGEPAIGLAVKGPRQGDDTFICCWFYEQ